MLESLLKQTNYSETKTQYLVSSFKNGFDLGYEGDRDVNLTAPNLKFTIGDRTQLWNKVMKEVKELRYAGPFAHIPFKNFIQSPIGLVPKDGGRATRLIFHLSYPRLGTHCKQKSVNGNTPKSRTTVKYPDFEQAIRMCLLNGPACEAAKSDLKSAFRHLGIRPQDWKLLVMKAQSPLDNKIYYFVDKCLPFGAAISCSHFQEFSNALQHIVAAKIEAICSPLNYLDDFFFVAIVKYLCDQQVEIFLSICAQINFPVSLEKTEWGSTQITFLSLLIDTIS